MDFIFEKVLHTDGLCRLALVPRTKGRENPCILNMRLVLQLEKYYGFIIMPGFPHVPFGIPIALAKIFFPHSPTFRVKEFAFL